MGASRDPVSLTPRGYSTACTTWPEGGRAVIVQPDRALLEGGRAASGAVLRHHDRQRRFRPATGTQPASAARPERPAPPAPRRRASSGPLRGNAPLVVDLG